MDNRVAKISALLHEASGVHHAVYRKMDGDDPDWASWYSDWLTNFSELPEILGKPPVRSELTCLLVTLGKNYGQERPSEGWEDWYAERILAHFAAE